MLPAKHFYMIRHGETEANKAEIMAGSMDSPLTEKGRAQAKVVQSIVKALDIKPKVIVHSHLSRARDTAMIINEGINVPLYEDKDVAELHAGDWEGVSYDECRELLKGWATPPNGESFAQFCKRLQRGKTHNLNKHDTPILIVCHGGVFRGLGGIYNLRTPAIFKNCHLYEFKPAPNDKHFPWEVWTHEDEQTREKCTIFHDSEVSKEPML
ncbi:MAG: hypothetical protein COB14_01320 [Alphaproteobacteria bacterium]|nr:MAG: hypothetical protein COB14_01320 [Alphaproteobacteria bacterium]